MVTLQITNNDLLINSKYSYLVGNNLSGVSTLTVINSDGFADDDYLLLGEFGAESSEIVQIDTGGVNTSTHVLTLTAATKFSHSESTKVSIIKYNQVQFYHTATATFATDTQVGANINVQADSLVTKIYDSTNTTGFGWTRFLNSSNSKVTQNSNEIPYLGFSNDRVREIFNAFYSLLNNQESSLISNSEAFYFLNEGYAIARSELNLVNKNFTVGAQYDLSVTSGTQEYDLSSLLTNFAQLLSVYDSTDNKKNIGSIEHSQVALWDSSSANTVKYYLRGDYIGFSPEPTASATYKLKYLTGASTLSSYYDAIDLPNSNYFFLIDFMLYRAAIKLRRNDADNFFKAFRNGMDLMKLTARNRDGSIDSFGISPQANV